METDNSCRDAIFVSGIPQIIKYGSPGDEWHLNKPQQAYISARIIRSTLAAGLSDNVEDTMDYSLIQQALVNLRMDPAKKYDDIMDVIENIGYNILKALKNQGILEGEIVLSLPKKMSLSGGDLSIRQRIVLDTDPINGFSNCDMNDFEIRMWNMTINPIIGVRDRERKQRQPLKVDILIPRGIASCFHDHGDSCLPPRIIKMIEESTFLTLEALGHAICKLALSHLTDDALIRLKLSKPAIFSIGEGPGIEITRTQADFQG